MAFAGCHWKSWASWAHWPPTSHGNTARRTPLSSKASMQASCALSQSRCADPSKHSRHGSHEPRRWQRQLSRVLSKIRVGMCAHCRASTQSDVATPQCVHPLKGCMCAEILVPSLPKQTCTGTWHGRAPCGVLSQPQDAQDLT